MLRGEDDEENPPEPLRIKPPVPLGSTEISIQDDPYKSPVETSVVNESI